MNADESQLQSQTKSETREGKFWGMPHMLITIVPIHHSDVIQFTLPSAVLMTSFSYNPHSVFIPQLGSN